MCGWKRDARYDYSSFGSDYDVGLGFFAGQLVTTKGSPDQEMYWDGNNHWVRFQTGSTVKYFDSITTPNWGFSVLCAYFFGIQIKPEFYFRPGFIGGLQFAIPPDNAIPDGFGIPQQSTRYHYGPWVTLAGAYNPQGMAEVVSDASLSPETFGGYANLQRMGNITATVGTARMTDNESGFVEVVGAPIGGIGERFAASGPYCTNVDVNVDATGGVKTTYKFNTWTPNFGKLAKYNIDRIATINKASWAFAKENRDKIDKRPFPKVKFEKTDLVLAKAKFSLAGLNMMLGPQARVGASGLGKSAKGGTNVAPPIPVPDLNT
jgi:hypothetical protein